MKKSLIAAVALSVGCPTTVHLTVHNPATFALESRVVVKDDNGLQKGSEIALGVTQPGATTTRNFEVAKGASFEVDARIPGSADVFATSQSVTKHDPNPFPVKVEMVPRGNLLDDKAAVSTVSDAFSRLGKDVGFKPLQVDNALDTWYGALVLIQPPDDQNPDGARLFMLPPGQFSPKETTGSFKFPANKSDNHTTLSKTASASVSASVTLYSMGVSGLSSDVMEVQWGLSNFGMVEKPDPADFNYVTKLASLPADVKEALYTAYASHPKAVLLYVNRMYVIEQALFSVKAAQKLAINASASAGSFVTANGAYSFENSKAETRSFLHFVMNIEGIEITLSTATTTGVVTPVLRVPPDTLKERPDFGKTKLIPTRGTRSLLLTKTMVEP